MPHIDRRFQNLEANVPQASRESSAPHYLDGGTGHGKSEEEKREKHSQRKRKEIVFTKPH